MTNKCFAYQKGNYTNRFRTAEHLANTDNKFWPE